jgi:hypothetical protein
LRRAFDRARQHLARLGVAAHQRQQRAEVAECVGVVGAQCQRAAERGLGVLQALQAREHLGAALVRLDHLRVGDERLVEAGQRLLQPLQLAQRPALVVQRLGHARTQRQRAVGAAQGLGGLAHAGLRHGAATGRCCAGPARG